MEAIVKNSVAPPGLVDLCCLDSWGSRPRLKSVAAPRLTPRSFNRGARAHGAILSLLCSHNPIPPTLVLVETLAVHQCSAAHTPFSSGKVVWARRRTAQLLSLLCSHNPIPPTLGLALTPRSFNPGHGAPGHGFSLLRSSIESLDHGGRGSRGRVPRGVESGSNVEVVPAERREARQILARGVSPGGKPPSHI